MPISGDNFYFKGSGRDRSKPALVFIHGAGGNISLWPLNLRKIGNYRTYALDLPGHGKSGGLGKQTIKGYAQKVADWLYSLAEDRIIIVGHSMGGAVGLSLALDHRDLVAGLVLISSGAKLKVNRSLLDNLSQPRTVNLGIEKIVGWSTSDQTEPHLAARFRERMNAIRPSVLHGDYLACDQFNVGERLGEITIPVLVISGSEDKMTPLRNSEYLKDNLTHSTLKVYGKISHILHMEKPTDVAADISKFLNMQYLG